MSKHTPGPWLIVHHTVYALTEDGKRNRFYAAVQDPFTSFEELGANARLIAASPELLDALQVIFDDIKQGAIPNHDDPWWAAARAAIAKATGEEA